jgi:hypothetical protein
VIFCTPGRVDIEPPSVADSLRECAMTNPQAYQAAVDDVEDEVVKIFSSGYLNSLTSSQNIFLQVIRVVW